MRLDGYQFKGASVVGGGRYFKGLAHELEEGLVDPPRRKRHGTLKLLAMKRVVLLGRPAHPRPDHLAEKVLIHFPDRALLFGTRLRDMSGGVTCTITELWCAHKLSKF